MSWGFCVAAGCSGLGGRFRASKAAQSRRGKNEIIFPPDPRRGSMRSGRRLHSGRLWLQRIPLNFRLTRKESSAKSPHGFFWRFRCSRWRLSNFAFPLGEGGRALARSDEVFLGHSGPNPTNIRKAPKKLVFCRFFARKSLTIPASTCMMEHDFRLLLEVDSFDE